MEIYTYQHIHTIHIILYISYISFIFESDNYSDNYVSRVRVNDTSQHILSRDFADEGSLDESNFGAKSPHLHVKRHRNDILTVK